MRGGERERGDEGEQEREGNNIEREVGGNEEDREVGFGGSGGWGESERERDIYIYIYTYIYREREREGEREREKERERHRQRQRERKRSLGRLNQLFQGASRTEERDMDTSCDGTSSRILRIFSQGSCHNNFLTTPCVSMISSPQTLELQTPQTLLSKTGKTIPCLGGAPPAQTFLNPQHATMDGKPWTANPPPKRKHPGTAQARSPRAASARRRPPSSQGTP